MVTLPSWDLFIGLFFIINLAYGLILQRDKVLLTLISIYVALVISQNFSEYLGQFFIGDKTILGGVWIKSSASPFIIKTVLFTLTIIVLATKSGLGGSGARKGALSPLEVIVYSFFSSALIVSTLLTFLPADQANSFIEQSQVAKIIFEYRLWWLALPPISLVVTGMKSSSGHNNII